MRIALVHKDLWSLNRGGICTLYLSLAHEMLKAGHFVYLITQNTGDTAPVPCTEVVYLPRTQEHNRHLQAVSDVLMNLKPDVAECSTWEFELLGYLTVPLRRRAPVLIRGDLSAKTMGVPEYSSGECELLKRSDLNIAISAFAQRDLEAAYGVPISRVVHCGVNRRLFRAMDTLSVEEIRSGDVIELSERGQVLSAMPIRATYGQLSSYKKNYDLPIILWCGKIGRMKGWDILEDIVNSLEGIARFIILLGHSEAYLPVSIHDKANVLFLQDIANEDMPKLYSLADYVLSTSRWEGFGLSILEAMACGTTVLLPDSLKVAEELIIPNTTGFAYRSINDIVTIVSKRLKMLPQIPSGYNWQANYAETLNLYTEMLIS
jgi:D-inositol-3-phosphate glycosyltransferase